MGDGDFDVFDALDGIAPDHIAECRVCPEEYTDDDRPAVVDWADQHQSETGHEVLVLDREDADGEEADDGE